MSQPLVYSSRTWLTEPLAITDDTIYVDNINNITNTIVQTATAPVAVLGVMSIGLYANKNTIVNIVVYNNTTSTVISSSHYTLVIVDTAPTLRITTGAWIATGNSLTITTIDGNLIYINGEQIKFSSVNTADNTLSNLSRGQNVTPAEYLIAKYTEVWGLLPKNKMNNVGYVNTWNSYNYNTVIGDPLQISTTSEALFLTNNKYKNPFPIISPIPQTTTSTTTAAPTTYSFTISPTTWIGNISGPINTTTTTTSAPTSTTTTTSAPTSTTTTTSAPGTTTTTTSAPGTTTTTTSAPGTTTTTSTSTSTSTTSTSTSTSTTSTSTSTSTTSTSTSTTTVSSGTLLVTNQSSSSGNPVGIDSCSSGASINYYANGVLNLYSFTNSDSGGFNEGNVYPTGQWLTGGDPSQYYMYVTQISGYGTYSGQTTGTWLQMNVDRGFGCSASAPSPSPNSASSGAVWSVAFRLGTGPTLSTITIDVSSDASTSGI